MKFRWTMKDPGRERFLCIAVGVVGLTAAYRYDLPLGLLGLLLIVSGIAGWCPVCTTAETASRRFQSQRPPVDGPGGDPA